MKSFKEYLQSNKICFSAFMISRKDMPQIKDSDHFIKYLDSIGVESFKDYVNPIDYQPTQTDKSQAKIDRLIKVINDDIAVFHDYARVIVSEDGFVLDGHHRYFAAKECGIYMNVIVVNLTINQLLYVCKNYNKD